ncbi:MAG: hypothetical protein VB099_18510 [Candidatus Limiplasma sp.]|nr:hypothetical protein [Candidatus Limiplasma sp.]
MEETLRQMRLCGLLPCLEAETLPALLAGVQALQKAGFPCAEVNLAASALEAAAWKRLLAGQPLALGVRVQTGEEARLALAAGARWATLPAAEAAKGLREEAVFWLVEDARELRAVKAEGPNLLCWEAGDVEAALEEWPHALLLAPGGEGEAENKRLLASSRVLALRVPMRVREDGAQEQAAVLRQQWAGLLGFSLAHIGINSAGERDAAEIAQALAMLMGAPYLPGSASDFAGTAVEVMKEPGRGKHGHIGIGTENLERGMYFVRQCGFSFDPASRKNDASGRAVLYYLNGEIGGFALHLLQK